MTRALLAEAFHLGSTSLFFGVASPESEQVAITRRADVWDGWERHRLLRCYSYVKRTGPSDLSSARFIAGTGGSRHFRPRTIRGRVE